VAKNNRRSGCLAAAVGTGDGDQLCTVGEALEVGRRGDGPGLKVKAGGGIFQGPRDEVDIGNKNVYKHYKAERHQEAALPAFRDRRAERERFLYAGPAVDDGVFAEAVGQVQDDSRYYQEDRSAHGYEAEYGADRDRAVINREGAEQVREARAAAPGYLDIEQVRAGGDWRYHEKHIGQSRQERVEAAYEEERAGGDRRLEKKHREQQREIPRIVVPGAGEPGERLFVFFKCVHSVVRARLRGGLGV